MNAQGHQAVSHVSENPFQWFKQVCAWIGTRNWDLDSTTCATYGVDDVQCNLTNVRLTRVSRDHKWILNTHTIMLKYGAFFTVSIELSIMLSFSIGADA